MFEIKDGKIYDDKATLWTGTQTVSHITVNGKYRIQIERSAVKGIDGFKVETYGDEINGVKIEASQLYDFAKHLTTIISEPVASVVKDTK